VGAPAVSLPGIGSDENRNLLVGSYPGATGVKTGFTEAAGNSLVASARRDDRELVAVVLGGGPDPERFRDAAALLDHGFTAFAPAEVSAELTLLVAGGTRTVTVEPATVTAPAGASVVVDLPLPSRAPETGSWGCRCSSTGRWSPRPGRPCGEEPAPVEGAAGSDVPPWTGSTPRSEPPTTGTGCPEPRRRARRAQPLASARDLGPTGRHVGPGLGPASERAVIEMELIGVRVELPANQPIVLLKETGGTRYLPIWIGAVEATAIAFALQGVETPRPLTHDLFVAVLGETGIELTAVHVTDLRDGTFYAELHLRQGSGPGPSRPGPPMRSRWPPGSRTSPCSPPSRSSTTPGLEIDRTDEDGEHGVDAEEEVRQFREFLDQVTPSDFEGNG
jgi:uncharacterized protein